MLPNFLIIGAEKAATTWLARCLAEHPAVYMPAQKEIYYFSTRFHNGIEWYEEFFRGWNGEAAIGEATPVYLSHMDAASRIRATLGEILFLVSVRHPVDRAYSAYWHNLRRGRLSLDSDFRSSFEADRWEIRSRGEYFVHLSRYLKVFPRERLLVLIYERIREHPADALRECLNFLGVDSFFTPSVLYSRLNEGGRDIRMFNETARILRARLRAAALWGVKRGVLPRNAAQRVIPPAQLAFERLAYGWGPRARQYEPLERNVRAELVERYYKADIKRLEELLQVDLSHWYRSEP